MFSLYCGFYTFTVPKKKKKLGKTWFLRFCQGFYLYDNLASRKKKMFFLEKVGIVLDSFELCIPKSLPNQNVLQYLVGRKTRIAGGKCLNLGGLYILKLLNLSDE